MASNPRKSRGGVSPSAVVTMASARSASAKARATLRSSGLKSPPHKSRGRPVDTGHKDEQLAASRGSATRQVGNVSNGIPAFKQYAPASPANPLAPGVAPSGKKALHRGLSPFGGEVNPTPVASQQVVPITAGQRIF